MGELTRADFDKHRRNMSRLISGGANDQQIEIYLKSEKITTDDLRTPPDFVPIPDPILPDTPFQIDPTAARVAGGLAGATVGGAVGLAGGPAAPATVPGGALIGGALGAEFLGQSAEILNRIFAGESPPPLPQQSLRAAGNIATDVALSGAAGAVVPFVKGIGSEIISPLRNRLSGRGALANLREFREAGIPTAGNAGAITGNRAIQGTEQALSRLPTSARTMQLAAERTQTALADELERIVSGMGAARTPFTAGRQIIKGVESFAGKVRNRGRELYDLVPISRTDPVRMDTTTDFIRQDLQAFAEAPELQALVVSPKLQGIFTAIERNKGVLTWEQTKRLRTAIGERISDPRLISDASTAEMKKLYAVLTADMESAARTQGGSAIRAWERANRFWKASMSRLGLVEVVVQSPRAERAFNAALSGAKDGPTLLRALKKTLPKEQWGDLQAAVTHQLGQANPGAQDAAGELFSARTFLSNWNRLAPESKTALYGASGSLRREMDRLARITASLKDIDVMANPSGTAGQNVFMQLLQGQIGAIPGVAAGSPTGALAGAGVALGTPFITAKVFTSPRFVNWLAKGFQIAPANFNGVAAHLGRLAAIKAREPDLTEEIDRIVHSVVVGAGLAQ